MNNNILLMHIPKNNSDFLSTPIIDAGCYSIMVKNIDKTNVLDHYSILIEKTHCCEENNDKLIFFMEDIFLSANETKETEIYLPQGTYTITVRGYSKNNEEVTNALLYLVTAYLPGNKITEHDSTVYTDMLQLFKEF